MGLHVFFGCYFNLFRLMAKCGVLENLLLKEHTHTFCNLDGDVRDLDFRLYIKDLKIGAPLHGACGISSGGGHAIVSVCCVCRFWRYALLQPSVLQPLCCVCRVWRYAGGVLCSVRRGSFLFLLPYRIIFLMSHFSRNGPSAPRGRAITAAWCVYPQTHAF